MRIDLHGRGIEALRNDSRWEVFHLGADGKRQRAWDIVIPEWVAEDDVVGCLGDLFHEHAHLGQQRARVQR